MQTIGEREVAAKLSDKEEKFCRSYILNVGSKMKAYEAAGYSMKMSSAALLVEADKIFNRPKVALRIKELQKLETTAIIKTKQDKLLILEKIMDRCSVDDDERGVLNAAAATAAVKEHNLMQGDNAPTQVENNHTITKADDVEW